MHQLVEFDGIVLEGKHVIREDDDFVISAFMVTDQELTGLELVGVHRIQQLQS